jgi:glycosyltransferase involved in cell wall biosynthesis
MSKVVFTVSTPTFNRAESLARVYASLRAQTFRAFEWLVVDDGSTDDTAARVLEWQKAAPFRVRYFRQANQGKHCAYNRALERARGEFFTVLDSDDELVPTALERLLFHWQSIPESDRQRFSGVTCLCADTAGVIVGRRFPRDILDCRHYEAEARFGAIGEKWGFHRTSVVRGFPFPEIAGERLCPDALVWNRIAAKFLVRHVNEALRVYHPQADGLTAGWTRGLIRSPRSARLFYQEYLRLDVPSWWKCKRALNYVRYSLHAKVAAADIVGASAAPALAAVALLPGWALYVSDRLRRAG